MNYCHFLLTGFKLSPYIFFSEVLSVLPNQTNMFIKAKHKQSHDVYDGRKCTTKRLSSAAAGNYSVSYYYKSFIKLSNIIGQP